MNKKYDTIVNENAKETMQEKINWMLVTEASRQAVY